MEVSHISIISPIEAQTRRTCEKFFIHAQISKKKAATDSVVENSYLAAQLSNDAQFWPVVEKFHTLQLWYSTEP
jgi:hypothetical protein